MIGLADRQLFVVAVILYGVSALHTVFLWRRGFQRHDHITYGLLLGGFAFHTAAMFQRGLTLNHCPTQNLYEASVFISWTIVATYLVLGLWGRLRFLGAFASPVVLAIGIFALMPSLDKQRALDADPVLPAASVHAALVLLSYGAFGLGAVAALMYLTQEYNLKFNKLRALLSLLPPIQRLETAMDWLLSSGFVLLTLGLMASHRIKPPPDVRMATDPKVVWSMGVWALFLGLLILRWGFNRRGRRLAMGLLGVFAFVLLTFWGTALLSPLHNPPLPKAAGQVLDLKP